MSEAQGATGSTGKHRDRNRPVDTFTRSYPGYVPRHRKPGWPTALATAKAPENEWAEWLAETREADE